MLNDPQHPYTRDLLAAVPDPGHVGFARPDAEQDSVLVAVSDAEPADPHRPPSGCRYHPRCPIGPLVRADRDICRTVEPTAEHRHLAACHFAADARPALDLTR